MVTALENSVNGDTKATIETFEFYRQEIKTFSEGLEESAKMVPEVIKIVSKDEIALSLNLGKGVEGVKEG